MNIDSFTINNNPQDIQTETHTVNNNRNKALNFIFNSNYKLFQKDSQESETNSQLNIPSYKREILFKLTSFSQGKQNVVFSNGIEEIYDDDKNDGDEKFFENISNKKFNTPPRTTKSSYKKTKDHIKTPYKTTKSHSSINKSKKSEKNNKSNLSTKSNNYWKSLFFDEEMINNNISQDVNIDINHMCNSVIIENPFNNKIEYRLLFCNNFSDDNDEELNKST